MAEKYNGKKINEKEKLQIIVTLCQKFWNLIYRKSSR